MAGMDTVSNSRWGVAAEHFPGLAAMLLAPVAVWLLLRAVHAAAGLGSAPARRWLDRREATPLATRVAAGLLFTTGLIHLALVPAHRPEEPDTALLFLIDAALLTLAAAKVSSSRRWRSAAALLLVADVAVYLGYLLGRREQIDQLGVATKLIELLALGLILVPAGLRRPAGGGRLRRSSAVGALLVSTSLTGTVLWGVTVRAANDRTAMDKGGGLGGMLLQPVP
ncbi:MAG: hypothetical protein ACR2OO_07520, partial [Thermomicrobiales bacterium]